MTSLNCQVEGPWVRALWQVAAVFQSSSVRLTYGQQMLGAVSWGLQSRASKQMKMFLWIIFNGMYNNWNLALAGSELTVLACCG